jgi:hypothetical protein
MFTDQYFDKEENAKVFDILVKWLVEGIELNAIDAADPDLLDPHPIPDVMHMSRKLKMCLQVIFFYLTAKSGLEICFAKFFGFFAASEIR